VLLGDDECDLDAGASWDIDDTQIVHALQPDQPSVFRFLNGLVLARSVIAPRRPSMLDDHAKLARWAMNPR
jgi:hypothetical protein